MSIETETTAPEDANALMYTLSQQSTASLGPVMPPATAGNQVPPEVRERYLAERRGQRPRGIRGLLSVFKHPKSAASSSQSSPSSPTSPSKHQTFGRFSVTYGGGGGNAGAKKPGPYGGLM